MKCFGFNSVRFGPCCNDGKFEHKGKFYCTSHFSIVVNSPEKMEKARLRFLKHIVKFPNEYTQERLEKYSESFI